ncbi:MAG: efflux RND transporter periplasmic adaptor subunit [Candidatus Zixiibacteriota bacterium]
MSEKSAGVKAWKDSIPGRARGRLALIVVIALAFSLGALLFSGGPSEDGADSGFTQADISEPEVWTCSMHPQIQLPKAGKCPICFMDLIPLETGSDEDLGSRQLKLSDAARLNARIETAKVRRGFAESEIRMVGKLTYDETRVSYITAWIPGRLDRLYADFTGVTVQEGEHLVYMYSPELLATQEELLQAKAAVAALARGSEILRTTAQLTLDASREKLSLYGLSDDQIAEIEKTGSASDHLTINAPIGGVVVHKNALEGMYVKTGSRIYTIADLSRLWVMFEAYESDLQWLRYGQRVAFRSPSFPGELFTAQVTFIDPVLDEATRTVNVRAIFDNSRNRLKPDMFVSGTVKSRINSKGEVIDENFAGKWIGPMHPEVVKDGPGKCDVCGMPLVSAESLGYAASLEEDETALVIPASAPLLTGARAVVYVELPDREEPVFEGRVVELGPRAGDWYVVRSGLSEGERVVVNGAFKIDAELQIRAKPSMMLPEGGGGPIGHQHGDPAAASERHSGAGKTKDSHPTSDEIDVNVHSDQETSNEISETARAALSPVYQAYFGVQKFLAQDDHDGAVEAYAQLEREIGEVDMSLFAGDAHMRWMSISASLSNHASRGAMTKGISEARSSFLQLSKSAIELERAFGHADDREYYLAFCPMADNNKGAFWMQTTDVINNSFFGASMLRCGSVKEVMQPRGN